MRWLMSCCIRRTASAIGWSWKLRSIGGLFRLSTMGGIDPGFTTTAKGYRIRDIVFGRGEGWPVIGSIPTRTNPGRELKCRGAGG